MMATLGGNISPYLFFWQADLEATEETTECSSSARSRTVGRKLLHVAEAPDIGMVFSSLIIFFIEVATAATLFKAGKHSVNSAMQAAHALRPLLGNTATITWAVGMVGAGLLAVLALTGSTADDVASTFGWSTGSTRSSIESSGSTVC